MKAEFPGSVAAIARSFIRTDSQPVYNSYVQGGTPFLPENTTQAPTDLSRRRVLQAAGELGALGFLAACGLPEQARYAFESGLPTSTPPSPEASPTTTVPAAPTETQTAQEANLEPTIYALMTNVSEFVDYRSDHRQEYDLPQNSGTQITINTGVVDVPNGVGREYRLYVLNFTREDPNDDNSPVRQISVGKYAGPQPGNPNPLDAFTLTKEPNGSYTMDRERDTGSSYVTDHTSTRPLTGEPPFNSSAFQDGLTLMNRYFNAAKSARFGTPFSR